MMMLFIVWCLLVVLYCLNLLRLSETHFATAPSVTTLRFACISTTLRLSACVGLIALRASCLFEAAQGIISFHRFVTTLTISSTPLFPESISTSGAIPFEQSRLRVSKLLNELIKQMMPEGSGTTSG